jgi:hypothetical protein
MQLIDAVRVIPADQQEEVIRLVSELMTNQTNGFERAWLVDIVKAMPADQRKEVIRLAREWMTPQMNWLARVWLMNAVKERADGLRQISKPLEPTTVRNIETQERALAAVIVLLILFLCVAVILFSFVFPLPVVAFTLMVVQVAVSCFAVGCFSVYQMYKYLKNKDLTWAVAKGDVNRIEELLRGLSPEQKKEAFNQADQSFGARLGLEGYSIPTYRAHYSLNETLACLSREELQDNNPQLIEARTAFSNTLVNHSKPVREIAEAILRGERVVIQVTWIGELQIARHAVTLVFANNLVMKCNRGAGSGGESGVTVFKRPKNLSLKKLIQALERLKVEEGGQQYFYKTIDEELGLTPEKLTRNEQEFLRRKPQLNPNCPIASAKTALVALLFSLFRNDDDFSSAQRFYKTVTGRDRERALVAAYQRNLDNKFNEALAKKRRLLPLLEALKLNRSVLSVVASARSTIETM